MLTPILDWIPNKFYVLCQQFMVKSSGRWEMISFRGIKVKLLPCLCKVHTIMSFRWGWVGGLWSVGSVAPGSIWTSAPGRCNSWHSCNGLLISGGWTPCRKFVGRGTRREREPCHCRQLGLACSHISNYMGWSCEVIIHFRVCVE